MKVMVKEEVNVSTNGVVLNIYKNRHTVFGDMMSESPCPSTAHHAVDEVLYGEDESKFTPPSVTNSTSPYLSHLTSAQTEVSQIVTSSQTYKHFLAQKYAAESTSDTADSAVNNDTTTNNSSSAPSTPTSAPAVGQQQHLTLVSQTGAAQQQQQFQHHQISSFYPFSPLVSSSSHFDSRNLLVGDGAVESPSTSGGGQAASGAGPGSPESENAVATAAAAQAAALFNENAINAIAGFIKDVDVAPNPHLVTTIQQTTNAGGNNGGVTSTSTNPDSSLFDVAVAGDTVDSTTTHSLNANISPNSSSQISLSSATYAAFGYNSQQTQQQHLQQNGSSVLTYGHLSPNNHHQFSTATLLHMDSQLQQQNHQHQQLLLPSLSSPTMSQIDSYFNNSSAVGKTTSPLIHEQLQMHQISLPATLHQANFIVNDSGHCGGLLTAEETNCFLNDLNDQNGQHHHIVGSFVPQNDKQQQLPVHNVISDVPVLTRARASLPIEYLYLAEHSTPSEGRRLAVFARKSIPSKTQFGPIEGVIASFKNELYSLSQIAYSAKDYLHIFISESVLLNQEDENNSNWTRFVRPATNPQEQNIELITKEFADTNELKFFLYTTRNILPSEELKVWYSDEYCARFRIRTQAETAAIIAANQQQQQAASPGISVAAASAPESGLSTADIGHKLRNKIAKTQPEVQLGGGSHQNFGGDSKENIELHEEEEEMNHQVNLQTLMAVDAHSLSAANGTTGDLHFSLLDDGSSKTGQLNNSGSDFIQTNGTATAASSSSAAEMNSCKTVVGGKSQYKCGICERVFPRQYSLRRHLVMHSGEKKYKCHKCGMAFNHVYNRNRHMKKHDPKMTSEEMLLKSIESTLAAIPVVKNPDDLLNAPEEAAAAAAAAVAAEEAAREAATIEKTIDENQCRSQIANAKPPPSASHQQLQPNHHLLQLLNKSNDSNNNFIDSRSTPEQLQNNHQNGGCTSSSSSGSLLFEKLMKVNNSAGSGQAAMLPSRILERSPAQSECSNRSRSSSASSFSSSSSSICSDNVSSTNLFDVKPTTSESGVPSSSGASSISTTSSNIINSSSSKIGFVGDKPYRCRECYKRFSTKERLDKHQLVHDETAKHLSCEVCERKFLTNSALSCHIKTHSFSTDEPRKYDCTLCGQMFETIQQRREHVAVHINPETGLYHCSKCTKTFDDFSPIRKHIKSFHSEEVFQCLQCEKVFPRQDKLRLHMLCHSNHWEFKCDFCAKQFKRKDKLKEHTQRMHAPDRDMRIAATITAKLAARAQRLKANRTKNRVATKPSQPNYNDYMYKCTQCLLGFKRRGMLVNHLAKRHPDVRYDSVPELTMPIIKTSKDYYCQYCDKIYKSSSKRKAHIVKNHPGKALPASNRNKSAAISADDNNVVNSTFSATVGSITTHPHFCNWCHKQYASKAKLMQHQRKKHPEKMVLMSSSSSSSSTSITASSSLTKAALKTISAGDISFASITTSDSSVKSPDGLLEDSLSGMSPLKLVDAQTVHSMNDSQQISLVNHYSHQLKSNQQKMGIGNGNSGYLTVLPNASSNSQHQFTLDNFGQLTPSPNNQSYLTTVGGNGKFVNGNNGHHHNGSLLQQQYAALDPNDQSLEDLLTMVGGGDDGGVGGQLNGGGNGGPVQNNIITILTLPPSGTSFSNDLDIITQITDFSSGKLLSSSGGSTGGHDHNSAGVNGGHQNHHDHLLLSDPLDQVGSTWSHECDGVEMAMV